MQQHPRRSSLLEAIYFYLPSLSDSKDSTLIMPLMRDYLTLWTPQSLAPADLVVVGWKEMQQEGQAQDGLAAMEL